jgi:hypothetical protein
MRRLIVNGQAKLMNLELFVIYMTWESDIQWIRGFFWWISSPTLQHFRRRRRKPTLSLEARVGLGEKLKKKMSFDALLLLKSFRFKRQRIGKELR